MLYIDVEAVARFRRTARPLARASTAPPSRARSHVCAPSDHVDYGAVARAEVRDSRAALRSTSASISSAQARRSAVARSATFSATAGARSSCMGCSMPCTSTSRRSTGDRRWLAEAGRPSIARRSATGDDELYRRHADRAEYFQYLQWQAELQLGAASEHARACGLCDRTVRRFRRRRGCRRRGNLEPRPPSTRRTCTSAPRRTTSIWADRTGACRRCCRKRLQAAGYAPVHRRLARGHAPCRRIAHRSRDGADALVLGAEGDAAGRRRLRRLSVRRAAGHRRARKQAQPLPGHRRGPGNGRARASARRSAAAGVLSYRPLYFERTARRRIRAARKLSGAGAGHRRHARPADAVRILGRRATSPCAPRLRLYAGDECAAAAARCANARSRTGCCARSSARESFADRDAPRRMTVDLMLAVHRFLARTPSTVMAVQLEDVFGQDVQVNLPSTTEDAVSELAAQAGIPLESWATNRRFAALTRMLRKERRAAGAARPASRRRRRLGRSATIRDEDPASDLSPAAAPAISDSPTLPRWSRISPNWASATSTLRPGSRRGPAARTATTSSTMVGSIPSSAATTTFAALAASLAAHGMGQMADIVPNHMGVMGGDNAWWLDVLENGRASQYAGYFDIDWTPPLAALSGKVLVPVLADNYGEVLLRGELQLEFDASDRRVQHSLCSSIAFPLDPRSYARYPARCRRRRAPSRAARQRIGWAIWRTHSQRCLAHDHRDAATARAALARQGAPEAAARGAGGRRPGNAASRHRRRRGDAQRPPGRRSQLRRAARAARRRRHSG